MTNKKAAAPTVAHGSIAKPSLSTASEATQFLELLGKDPAKTWFRTLKPIPGKGHLPNVGRKGADLHGFDPAALGANNKARSAIYFITGDADEATGKTGAVDDKDVHTCRAVFVEWDDKPMEWQLTAWETLNLPDPTVIVATGGPSLHCYWVLTEPLEPLEWRRITAQLITHCKSDPACSNPSRVMRLPGSIYYDKKTGQPTGQCRILSDTGTRYSAAEIEECLPAPAPTPVKPAAVEASRKWEPRSIEEINAAAEFIPERREGEGTYPESRNALCGCSAALAEAGAEDPDGMALALLGHLWPDEGKARQVLESTTTRAAGSFWAIAKKGGYQLKPSAEAASNAKKGAPMSYRGRPAKWCKSLGSAPA